VALKSITYQCPSCEGAFRVLLDLAREPPPRFCNLCGFDTESELPEGLAMPHLGKSIRGVVDKLNRDMEKGAEFRADIARAQFGLDAEDVSIMKQTNMKDGLRQGDTSNIEVKNDITRVMDMAPPGLVGFNGAAGLGYSDPVSSGPFPNAGARAQALVRQMHAINTADPRHLGTKLSSIPALETQQPGYRVRVR